MSPQITGTVSPATLKKIGSNIRDIRKARGLTQEALGELSGIHDRTVGCIERGEMNFAVLVLLSIAKALKVSANRILDV